MGLGNEALFSHWKQLSDRPGNRPTSCYLEGEASVMQF